GIVPRMGLSRKDELNRTLWIIHHCRKFFDVRQYQIRSLIRCEAPRKSYGQSVRTQNAPHALRLLTATLALFDGTHANEFEQLSFQREVCFPEFAVIDILYTFPNLRVAAVLVPAWTEVPVVEPIHLGREPCGHVNAVCNMTDRHFVFGPARIK